MSAKQSLESGAKYPYDAGEEWWDSVDVPPPPPQDWAHAAARGVIAELDGRGFDHMFHEVDHDIREELTSALTDIIRLAHKETGRVAE